jgi:hypothetical protein
MCQTGGTDPAPSTDARCPTNKDSTMKRARARRRVARLRGKKYASHVGK